MSIKVDKIMLQDLLKKACDLFRELTANLSAADWNLRKLIAAKRQDVLGLDIGSSTVRIVKFKKDDQGYVVTAAAQTDIAPTKDRNDKGSEEINTTKAISECLEQLDVQTKWAVCSVAGPETVVRYFEFPLLPEEEIPGAVLLEAEQVCPFNVNESSVDYQRMPMGKDVVGGVLVAATDKLISWKSQLTKNALLENVLMDADGLALLNCFSEFEKPEPGKTVAILNVGSSYTNLVIMNNYTSPFVRDIAYAGSNIIGLIANENNLSIEEVKKILAGDKNEKLTDIDVSLKNACRRLFVDVTETLRYYTAQEKTAAVKKVFVCGGFALVKDFIKLLDEHLPAEVVLWNPFDKIRSQVSMPCEDMLKEKGPAMAIAAGLAMRSI